MWDVIVIASGIGGLSAAAALGKRGKRVLVLELHSAAGGQTQTFRRQDWEFATGVHYVGGVGQKPGSDGQFGRLLSWLSDGVLQFSPCTNSYNIVRLPGFEFGIPHAELAYRAALLERFPDEQTAIDHWFRASRDARKAAFTLIALHSLPTWLAAGLRLWRGKGAAEWAQHTLASELARVSNPKLRAVLGAQQRHINPPHPVQLRDQVRWCQEHEAQNRAPSGQQRQALPRWPKRRRNQQCAQQPEQYGPVAHQQ